MNVTLKKHDRQSKEQFINGINDEMMTTEIITKITTIIQTSHITSEQVLNWATQEEVQRVWKAMLTNIEECKSLT